MKNIIATLFVVILLCKSVLTLVGAFSQQKHANVISQIDPAESENSGKEGEQKSSERLMVHEDFADLVIHVVINAQKFSNRQYSSAGVSPLTDLSVFTPPPERA